MPWLVPDRLTAGVTAGHCDVPSWAATASGSHSRAAVAVSPRHDHPVGSPRVPVGALGRVVPPIR
jgi:hypothetical protein